jgi:hypothetical protein
MTPEKKHRVTYTWEEERRDWGVAFLMLALIAVCTIAPELIANWFFPG